ncbi:MAG: alpha amylase N-terminal ig-like domain-containing protein [Lachnospiraceae bacterium]|nr:alpha amylase N-terminal ig-like domain-containing protein [Lachnospiraceae bacterium]
MDINQFQKAEKNQQYIAGMHPVLNRKALFSDTTEDYLSPAEPSAYAEVTVRFRSAKNNIDKVFFVSKGERHLMFKTESDAHFDYYAHTVQLENVQLSYYFEIYAGKLSCVYDRRGPVKDVNEYYFFRVIPGFKTPDWAKGAVFYQIYVDRFYNGDPTNDVLTNEYQYIGDKTVRVEDWNKYPAAMGVREFYGGDLQGVLDKMDYLQDLGVDVIYFNPLFVSPSNHKYDIQDYDYIDPHFGKIVHDQGALLENHQTENRFATRYIDRISNKENLEASNELFAEVVKEAHRRGMKVILDGVFNHCGSFNKWLDRERIYENAEGYEKGAYIDKDSPYHDYFQFFDEYKFPYNGSYDGWWGHDTLPKLNYENSRQLMDYVLYIGRKWVSPPYNVDGWRLDVAADLGHSPEFNHQFWKEFRKTVKMANPNAIILAEHYGSPRDWLQGQEWDTVMNYDAFM